MINAIRKTKNAIIFNNRWEVMYSDIEYDENWISLVDLVTGDGVIITRSTIINGQMRDYLANWNVDAIESVIAFDDWAGELPE